MPWIAGGLFVVCSGVLTRPIDVLLEFGERKHEAEGLNSRGSEACKLLFCCCLRRMHAMGHYDKKQNMIAISFSFSLSLCLE